MLNTQERSIYLEELKPPPGFSFDCAVATSFTLDLLTLLMAPLSLSLLEIEDKDELLQDPIMVLEALRKTVDKFLIFCQEGCIKIPNNHSLLYSYLEKAVVSVKSNRGNGIFHPKLWILRFVRNGDVFYRVLNLSRNVTFDRAWDTIVSLEGFTRQRHNGYTKNKPLRDFIRSLKDLSVRPLSESEGDLLEMIAHEIYRVEFEVPQGFGNEYEFSPSGIYGYKKQKFPQDVDRILVVAPFIDELGIDILRKSGENNVLVSREEELDELSDQTYNQLIQNTAIYYLDENIEEPEDDDKKSDASFKGLHAKLFHFDHGWYSTLIIGSANATRPAFFGENVEFMVRLTGKKSKVGIDTFIRQRDENTDSFMTFLREYKRYEQKQHKNEKQAKLDAMVDDLRMRVISLAVQGKVKQEKSSTYTIRVQIEGKKLRFPEGTTIQCYPITLSRDSAIEFQSMIQEDFVFRSVSLAALTSFIAFQIVIKQGAYTSKNAFVVNISMEGMPIAERDNAILISIVKDRSRFIRYLLLILMDDPDAFMLSQILSCENGANDPYADYNKCDADKMPLIEELVRAFSRNPEKIERISRLVDDIKKTEKAHEVLPLHFEQTWNIFMQAYSQRRDYG